MVDGDTGFSMPGFGIEWIGNNMHCRYSILLQAVLGTAFDNYKYKVLDNGMTINFIYCMLLAITNTSTMLSIFKGANKKPLYSKDSTRCVVYQVKTNCMKKANTDKCLSGKMLPTFVMTVYLPFQCKSVLHGYKR